MTCDRRGCDGCVENEIVLDIESTHTDNDTLQLDVCSEHAKVSVREFAESNQNVLVAREVGR